MATYSLERKRSVLNKLLPPHNMSVAVLAKQEGITEATLYNWRKQVSSKYLIIERDSFRDSLFRALIHKII
jgi:transposase-like protein